MDECTAPVSEFAYADSLLMAERVLRLVTQYPQCCQRLKATEVPAAMEVGALDIQGGHLQFTDLDTGRAIVRVPDQASHPVLPQWRNGNPGGSTIAPTRQ